MKKNLWKLLSLMLALCMVLCACGGSDGNDDDDDSKKGTTTAPTTTAPVPTDAELIVGTWTTEVNMADMMNYLMAGEDATSQEYLSVSEFMVTWVLEMDADGEGSLCVDLEQLEEVLEEYRESIRPALADFYEMILPQIYAEAMGDMTLEEYLGSVGMTLDDVIDVACETVSTELILEMMDADEDGVIDEFDYTCEDGKLYMDDEDSYMEIEFDGDQMKWIDLSEIDEDWDELLPLTWEKG